MMQSPSLSQDICEAQGASPDGEINADGSPGFKLLSCNGDLSVWLQLDLVGTELWPCFPDLLSKLCFRSQILYTQWTHLPNSLVRLRNLVIPANLPRKTPVRLD